MMRSFGSFQLVWLIGILLTATCESFDFNEVLALQAFKEAVYDDPHMVLSNWNSLDADPCNWRGIYCSPTHNHIITLNLSGSSLKGFLAPELGLLSSLQELALHNNNLLGAIPKQIGVLTNLKLLDLGMNQLSGPIPPELGNLVSATKINLQSNGLTGSVPSELGNLRNLIELRLDRNKLQGTVPANNSSISFNMQGMYASHGPTAGFCRSSQLKTADFSYNFFSGEIPECLKYLPRSSFQGNCFQDKSSKQRSAQQCGTTQTKKSHRTANSEHQHPVHVSKHRDTSKPGWLLALEIVTGTVAGFLLLFAVLTGLTKLKGKSPVIIPWKKAGNEKDQMVIYIDPDLLKDVKRWSRQELEVACEDFSNIIGSSQDSIVYKGVVKDGPEIAVICPCINEEYWTGYLELYFQKEVADLARINHENTGKLLGYCRESTPFSRMLVFQYASNGTLYEHLHYGEGCQLSWARRMRIIIGIARGLKYLHTELDPPFTISELNSSAVYLTEEFSPKVHSYSQELYIDE
ncbi:Leucine-rich repeat protein kinase family protein [Thalictrum thalictroides]|uniref:Leucine-rich repeat protein kinase family protein n=1 Tax=Thalictrum thalictroides TaxID=46969 RepID=A0A7J6UVP7_THATH|nr:Leucine-rich repeat protein kinase family protein [Thalictrum thalictroides]